MKITLGNRWLTVQREQGDPRFYSGGQGSGESRLLYHVKKALNARGLDLIKKRMWKDGHLVGDETTQYLRASKLPVALGDIESIYDHAYAIGNSVREFNAGDPVQFTVNRAHGEQGSR